MGEAALNEINKDLYALYDGSQSIEVAVEAERAAPIAHGWYTRVRRTGRALQVLKAVGFEHEGAHLRRSMIEHALGLYWLVDAKDGAVVIAESRDAAAAQLCAVVNGAAENRIENAKDQTRSEASRTRSRTVSIRR